MVRHAGWQQPLLLPSTSLNELAQATARQESGAERVAQQPLALPRGLLTTPFGSRGSPPGTAHAVADNLRASPPGSATAANAQANAGWAPPAAVASRPGSRSSPSSRAPEEPLPRAPVATTGGLRRSVSWADEEHNVLTHVRTFYPSDGEEEDGSRHSSKGSCCSIQ
jgi:hypothetical protein